ncbi:MAG: hypothetical protein JXQ96_00670 [Cyclobacteriaceae bacterium]
MKHLYLLAILCVFLACSNSKNAVSDTPKLQLSDVTPGRSSTALLGKIISAEQNGNNIDVTVSVISMKQGGASAPAFGASSKANIVFTPMFQKNYQNQNNEPVISVLTEGRSILIVVDRNLRSKQTEVIQLKTQK